MQCQLIIPKSRGEKLLVACCNWPNEYPYVPKVNVSLWHDGPLLYLDFNVSERYTLGVVTENNGAVWTDSCVEFFIAPDDSGYYYNFEFTCIGKMLLAYRPGRDGAIMAPMSVIDSIERTSSLGNQPVGLIHNGSWELKIAIPITALFNHNFKSWGELQAKGNIYKCGNNLPERHFISYAPILTAKPDFHCPEFFVPIDWK